MPPDLSWCHCRSWPCCPPITPDHRVSRNRAKGPSAAALVLFHWCRAVGAYRSPARLPGPAVGCAWSSVVLLKIYMLNKLTKILVRINQKMIVMNCSLHLYCFSKNTTKIECYRVFMHVVSAVKHLSVWWNSPPEEAAPHTPCSQNLQALTTGWIAP